jgi:hypothetical protein
VERSGRGSWPHLGLYREILQQQISLTTTHLTNEGVCRFKKGYFWNLSQALPSEPFGVWVIVRIVCEYSVFFVHLLIVFGVKLIWYTVIPRLTSDPANEFFG